MIEVQVEETKRNKYAHVIRGKRKNKTSGFLFRAFPLTHGGRTTFWICKC